MGNPYQLRSGGCYCIHCRLRQTCAGASNDGGSGFFEKESWHSNESAVAVQWMTVASLLLGTRKRAVVFIQQGFSRILPNF